MNPIAEIIKYEGDNSTFIWKHPCEDFNTTTQLIVHESQEAVFFLNGQALDLFGPGRHTLESQNIPGIRKVMNLSSGGETPFHCEVYFINKTEHLSIKWGTDSKIEYVEPAYNFPIKIGASGEMSIRAMDSRKLLIKVVGTERVLTQESLVQKLRAFLMTHSKTYLAQLIRAQRINVFEIDEKLIEISTELKSRLVPDFFDYGVSLERFFVTTIVKPEEDGNYQKFKELHYRQYADVAEAKLRQQVGFIDQQTDAQRMVIESKAISQKRQQEGYTYQQERGFDVAEKVAGNEAVGQFTNMGVGLGTMAGVGGAVGGIVGGAVTGALSSETTQQLKTQPSEQPSIFCDECGASVVAGALFCDNCGKPLAFHSSPICSKCGYTFEKQSRFCPNCGTKREN